MPAPNLFQNNQVAGALHPFTAIINITRTQSVMGKLRLLLSIPALSLLTGLQAQSEIPNAQPGKCYAKCYIPPQYEPVSDQVTLKSAYLRNTAIPAEFETQTRPQLVKDESKRLIEVPAVYETVTERIEVKAASKRYVNVPAVYEPAGTGSTPGLQQNKRFVITPATYTTVTERVEIKPAGKRLVVTPAEYENRTESYETEAAYTRLETLTPRYESVVDKIIVKPASMNWVRKRADVSCLGVNPEDCFVWCLVETPPVYESVTKSINKGCDSTGVADSGCIKRIEVPAKYAPITVRRLKKPAGSREENIPAEYQTITKQILKTPASIREETIQHTDPKQKLISPASFREEEVPAEYKTITRQVLKTPASIREEIIPAEYKNVSVRVVKIPATVKTDTIPAEIGNVNKRRPIKAGGFSEWREVLCGEKVTGYTIRQIQEALKKTGYYTGPVDNTMTPRTKSALLKFQQDKGLPSGNLDFETLKALGINY